MIRTLINPSEQVLITPDILINEFPHTSKTRQVVNDARHAINQILSGNDKRLLVIVGPCSIHDPDAALEYAHLLADAARQYQETLCIVMRAYFEKPRTTLGWKGLISDPNLDGSFDINTGLQSARKLLVAINELGLPIGTEFLDTFTPQYLKDLVSWCAIGARTSESQIHRELASYLPMPVGFKNTTDGNIQIAIDAMQVAQQSHPLLTINQAGYPMMVRTTGNHASHIVLRGSNQGTNFSAESVKQVREALLNIGLPLRIMIDCSHGNSQKKHEQQKEVINSVIQQLMDHEQHGIFGIMLESNLVPGKQQLSNKLIYGQSITDSCIGWDETRAILATLAHTLP